VPLKSDRFNKTQMIIGTVVTVVLTVTINDETRYDERWLQGKRAIKKSCAGGVTTQNPPPPTRSTPQTRKHFSPLPRTRHNLLASFPAQLSQNASVCGCAGILRIQDPSAAFVPRRHFYGPPFLRWKREFSRWVFEICT